MKIDDELKQLDPVKKMQESGAFWEEFAKKAQAIAPDTGLDDLDAEIEMTLQALDPIDKMKGADSFWEDFRQRADNNEGLTASGTSTTLVWLKIAACVAIAAISLWMLFQSPADNQPGTLAEITETGPTPDIGTMMTTDEPVAKTTIHPDLKCANVKEVKLYSAYGLMDMTDIEEGPTPGSELEFEDIEVLVTTFRPHLEHVVIKEINVYAPHGLMDITNFDGDSGAGSEFELDM